MRRPRSTSPGLRPARLLALALFLVTTATTSAASSPPIVAPAGQVGGGCPGTYAVNDEPPIWRYRGDLVPAGAIHATLCTYSDDSLSIDALTIDRVTTLPTHRVAALIRYLNLLPAAQRDYVHTCALAAFAQYFITLTYPDGTTVPVRLSTTCGTASYAGAVRRIGHLNTLLHRWNPTSIPIRDAPPRLRTNRMSTRDSHRRRSQRRRRRFTRTAASER